MRWEDLSPERRQVLEELDDWLRSHSTAIGPSDRPEDQDVMEDGEPLPALPCLLSEWMFITQWTDENGEGFTVMLSNHNLLRSHQMGLLRMALEEMV